jgi:hypothetical protein
MQCVRDNVEGYQLCIPCEVRHRVMIFDGRPGLRISKHYAAVSASTVPISNVFGGAFHPRYQGGPKTVRLVIPYPLGRLAIRRPARQRN